MILSWDTSPDSQGPIYFTPVVGTTLIQIEAPIGSGETWKLSDDYTTIYSLELYSGNPLLTLIGYRWDNKYRYRLRISSATAYSSSYTLELRDNLGTVWFSFMYSLSVGNNSFILYSQHKTSDPFSFTGRFSVIVKQQEVDSWGGSLTLNDNTYSIITLVPKVQTYTLNLYNDFDSTIYVWDSPTVASQPTYNIPAKTNKVPITAKGGITIQWPSNSTSYTAKIKDPSGGVVWSQYMPTVGEQRAITDESLLANLESMMAAGVYATLTK